MPYTITGSGDRCSVSGYTGIRCALRDGHMQHHVTADGRHFVNPGDLTGPGLGQSFAQWVASAGVPSPIASTPVSRVDAFQRDLVTGQQLHEALNEVRRSVDELRAKVLAEAESARQYTLQSHVNARFRELNERVSSVVATTDLRSRTTNNCLMSVESRLSGVVTRQGELINTDHNRIERLEKRLHEVSELAERNCCCEHAKSEVPLDGRWTARSPEPPRNGCYVDAENTPWVFRTNSHGSGWVYSWSGPDDRGPFYSWDELTTTDADIADFPWEGGH